MSLAPDLAAALGALRHAHYEILGRLPVSSDRVFLVPTGAAWAGTTGRALSILYRLLQRAKINLDKDEQGEVVDLHSLRRTNASWRLRHGQEIFAAARELGHDVRLLSETYAHLLDEHQRREAAKLPSLGATGTSSEDRTTSASAAK